MKQKAGSLKKVSKIDKSLTRLTKIKKRKDTNHQYQEWYIRDDIRSFHYCQNYRDEKGYYKQLCAPKFDNLEKMDQLFKN